MTAKEYHKNVVGQASVYRLNAHELTVEFSYSRGFKAEYLKCLEIGQGVRVPLYTAAPSVDYTPVDALIADAIKEHDAKNLLIKSVNMRTQAQPYLDALIAEIESIVKCAETATDGDTGDTIYIGEAYPDDDVKAVLDKYRSAK